MWFFKIFFQISINFIEFWLIFCKFRSYERSELQVHTGEGLRWTRLLLCGNSSQASKLERDSKRKCYIYSSNRKN